MSSSANDMPAFDFQDAQREVVFGVTFKERRSTRHRTNQEINRRARGPRVACKQRTQGRAPRRRPRKTRPIDLILGPSERGPAPDPSEN